MESDVRLEMNGHSELVFRPLEAFGWDPRYQVLLRAP